MCTLKSYRKIKIFFIDRLNTCAVYNILSFNFELLQEINNALPTKCIQSTNLLDFPFYIFFSHNVSPFNLLRQ